MTAAKIEYPKRRYAVTMLLRLMSRSEAEELWVQACSYFSVSLDTESYEDLEKVYWYLAEEPGAVGVLGCSLLNRLHACNESTS